MRLEMSVTQEVRQARNLPDEILERIVNTEVSEQVVGVEERLTLLYEFIFVTGN